MKSKIESQKKRNLKNAEQTLNEFSCGKLLRVFGISKRENFLKNGIHKLRNFAECGIEFLCGIESNLKNLNLEKNGKICWNF